jgi:flagellar biogenesis protein FliO
VRAKRIAAAVIGLAAWTGAAEPIDEGMTVAEYHGEARGAAAADPGAPDIARLLGVTLLLVGAAGGLYFLCRRLRGGRRVLRGRNVKVLETAYVSPKHTLALVRIRNRILLLGMGQDVRTLAEFARPEEVLQFDGAFSEEFENALERDGASKPAARACEPVAQLRKALDRWRHKLRGEARA